MRVFILQNLYDLADIRAMYKTLDSCAFESYVEHVFAVSEELFGHRKNT